MADSDIHGTGYGSAHAWKNKGTAPPEEEHRTTYACARCGQVFVHYYNLEPGTVENGDSSSFPQRPFRGNEE